MILNAISALFGLTAVLLLLPGIIPLLGWLQWGTLVLCVIGAVIGAFPEKKVGLTINLIVMAVAVLRLILGGGLI